MEKNEHILFQDIPARGNSGMFHSAILTTYAIDFIHLDTHVRSTLRRKQVCSINVFTDNGQAEKSLQYVNPIYLQHIGQDYCVSTIRSAGAFHPKINFFTGDNAAMVLIGSGNLTVTGHGKNHEVFTGFMVNREDEQQLPLLQECWQYLTNFARNGGTYEQRRILHEIPDNCPFLQNVNITERHMLYEIATDLEAALLYNEKGSSILAQIEQIIPTGDVKKITVVSPYYDENGEALNSLLALCPQAKMEVLIQEICSLPPINMVADHRIKFYDFDKTNRGTKQISDSFNRLAHVKAFFFETDTEYFCIVGSANATVAALGSAKRRGLNDELCVLYRSSRTDFQKHLGLTVRKKDTIDLSTLSLTANNRPNRQSPSIRLIGADYENELLAIEFETSIEIDNLSLTIEGNNSPIFLNNYVVKGQKLLFQIHLDTCPMLCYLNNSKGEIVSNKVFVNNISELNSTNPSPATRDLNSIISSIEADGISGVELVDMLNDVIWSIIDSDAVERKTKTYSSTNVGKNDRTLPDIQYNVDYDNDEPVNYQSIKVDRVSRLIECIENSIRMKLHSLDDELKDEEEEGDSETSNTRSDNNEKYICIDNQDVDSCYKSATNLLRSYQDFIQRRTRIYQELNDSVSKDDLALFSLALFGATEICYLSRFMYVFDAGNKFEESYWQKKLLDGLDRVMETDGAKTMDLFVRYCERFLKNSQQDEDFKRKGHRAIKYALLYATGIDRFGKNPWVVESVKRSMNVLISLFGLPQKETMEKELAPLLEQYDHVFELRYIERTLKKIGFDWD